MFMSVTGEREGGTSQHVSEKLGFSVEREGPPIEEYLRKRNTCPLYV